MPGLPGLPVASVLGALPHTDATPGLAVRAHCVCADAECDPVCCLCRAMFSAVFARSRSTSVPMLMGAPGRSPLLLRSPVRFMAKGVKRALLSPPVPRVGGGTGTASSLELAPSDVALKTAAVVARGAKRSKAGSTQEITSHTPWTNMNVPNRNPWMGTATHQEVWAEMACMQPGGSFATGGYVGDVGHWSNTRFSFDHWLRIEEASKNQANWDEAVKH